MSTFPITNDQVNGVIRQIVAEHPDLRNPLLASGNGCAYDKGNARDEDRDNPAVADHCLAGTAMIRLGLGLPEDIEEMTISQVIPRTGAAFTVEAGSRLRQVQMAADNSKDDVGTPVTWGSIDMDEVLTRPL